MKSRSPVSRAIKWVLLAIAAALIGVLVTLPFNVLGINDWRWNPTATNDSFTPVRSTAAPRASDSPTVSVDSSGPNTAPTTTVSGLNAGEVRFSFPEVDNGVHPYVLRPPTVPPQVTLTPVAASGSNRMLRVMLSDLGISIIQISMRGPDDHEYMMSAEILTSQPEMEFTYGVFPETAGTYATVVSDLRTGLSTRATIELPAQRRDPALTGPPIGNTPHLTVSGVTGRACEPAGAIVSIRAEQVEVNDILTARTPPQLSSGVHDRIDYTPASDSMGDGYYAIAVQATRCTDLPITGFVGVIGDRASLVFQVPN